MRILFVHVRNFGGILLQADMAYTCILRYLGYLLPLLLSPRERNFYFFLLGYLLPLHFVYAYIYFSKFED